MLFKGGNSLKESIMHCTENPGLGFGTLFASDYLCDHIILPLKLPLKPHDLNLPISPQKYFSENSNVST